MRCLREKQPTRSFQELLEKAVYEYNLTIHSTTGKKPAELFLGKINRANPEDLEKIRTNNIEKLKNKQDKDIEQHNKKRLPMKTYEIGESIYVKMNKRLGFKLTPRYRQEIVKEDRHTTVLTESGKGCSQKSYKKLIFFPD